MTTISLLCACVLLLVSISCVRSDIYLHSPRGSNDRLNENSGNRNNANRLFDSQNNNKGGYNVGIDGDSNSNTQYMMKFFQSGSNVYSDDTKKGESHLTIEWTNQHGCGGDEDDDPQKMNCNLVMQYMCQPEPGNGGSAAKGNYQNGDNTNTQDYQKPNNLDENKASVNGRLGNSVKADRGLQESWYWYDSCYVRERNQGLFTADQKLKNNGLGYSSAIYTRQNNNGNRYGYECPEERDYYPYWHPTPWKDAVVLAENATMCSHYQTKSFNVQPYHRCFERFGNNDVKHYSRWNNEEDCQANGGEWIAVVNYLEKASDKTTKQRCEDASGDGIDYMWAIPHDTEDLQQECLVALKAPECEHSPWTRSNYLGNGLDGHGTNYTWVLPHFPSGDIQRCVFRIRYNISTDDYDPYNTDYRHNEDNCEDNLDVCTPPPLENNPYVSIGGPTPLRLAINTAQFGRTFQDRSHVFQLKPRPDPQSNDRIFNINVRGKRGDIVQTYPAVPYDFVPNDLKIKSDDLVHFQWTGSNTHKNGNPAGDGQAGADGRGKEGTDRHNVVESRSHSDNYPLTFENSTLWKAATVEWIYHGNNNVNAEDLAINMASSGYYVCKTSSRCQGDSVQSKAAMDANLDNVPASYEGALLRLKTGTYHYMSTRNNAFSDASQKGKITVV